MDSYDFMRYCSVIFEHIKDDEEKKLNFIDLLMNASHSNWLKLYNSKEPRYKEVPSLLDPKVYEKIDINVFYDNLDKRWKNIQLPLTKLYYKIIEENKHLLLDGEIVLTPLDNGGFGISSKYIVLSYKFASLVHDTWLNYQISTNNNTCPDWVINDKLNVPFDKLSFNEQQKDLDIAIYLLIISQYV